MVNNFDKLLPELNRKLASQGIFEEPAEEPNPLKSVETTMKDVEYLQKKIQAEMPAEFFPANSFGRANQKKVEPQPFYRIGDKGVIAFNPDTKQYDALNLDYAATLLETKYNIPNTQGKVSQSRAKRAIKRMMLALPPVSYYGLIAGYEGGVYETRGHELVVVPYTERIKSAADVKAEPLSEGELPYYEKWKPLWEELFRPLLVSPTGDTIQYDIFCKYVAGCREVIGRGYESKIPVLAIVGAAGTGKTLLGDVVNAALTGSWADPTTYLYGETPFNSHLVGAPLWLVDDKQIRDQKIASRLKESVVGSGFQISKKYMADQPLLHPARAILILANDDLFSRKTIPGIDASTSDKVILFKAYEGGIPPCERSERWNRFMEALPYWLAYLDRYVVPTLDRTQRMIVSAWQNPEIMEMIFDDTSDGDLHAIIQTLLSEKPGLCGMEMTAHQWLKELEGCELTQRDICYMGMTPRKLGRKIEFLVGKHPELYEKSRQSGGNRDRMIRIFREAEES